MPHPFWHGRSVVSSEVPYYSSLDSDDGRIRTDEYLPLMLASRRTSASNTTGRIASLSKEEILEWLIECNDTDLLWILSSLAETRRDVLSKLSTSDVSVSVGFPDHNWEQSITLGSDGSSADPANIRKMLRASSRDCPPDAVPAVVQFSSPMFYCEENDGCVVIEILRIGSTKGHADVSYHTEDDSALAGVSYEAVQGIVHFVPGESMKQVRVNLVGNEQWDTTIEFKVVLETDGWSGAVLGEYLYETRVRIIDNDTFPTNRFKDVDVTSDFDSVPKALLLYEFCKMTWNLPGLHCGTVEIMLVDAFHNVSYLIRLFLTVYLLDFIIDTAKPTSSLVLVHDRFQSLLISAGIALVLHAMLHLLDFRKISFPVAGVARGFLQNAVLRKYLSYTQEARAQLEAGDVVMAIDRDATRLVFEGYLSCLKLAAQVGHLFCMLLFELLAPKLFGHPVHMQAAAALLGLPVILGLFLYLRTNTVAYYLEDEDERQNDLVNEIAITTHNFHLVLDYNLQSYISRMFARLVSSLNAAHKAAVAVVMNNTYFARWVTFVVIASYTTLGGMQVISGELSVGMFVTNLKVFEEVGKSCETIYDILVEMQSILPSMVSITRLVNLPSDVLHRMRLHRARSDKTDEMRDVLSVSDSECVIVDSLNIVLDLEKFNFASKQISKVNFKGVIEIKQGQLVAFVGHLGSGKATLLRLISGTMLPKVGMGGGVFVPAHLRTINVPDMAMFFGGTLFENLTFGIDTSRADASRTRVQSVCDFLGIDAHVLQYLDTEEEHKWQEIFSGAQCKLLNIARALTHNAELICFHKPLAMLDARQSRVVMDALHLHVKSKGILQTTNPQLRRPRTVIVTSSRELAVQESHEIIKVSHQKGLERLLHNQIKPDIAS